MLRSVLRSSGVALMRTEHSLVTASYAHGIETTMCDFPKFPKIVRLPTSRKLEKHYSLVHIALDHDPYVVSFLLTQYIAHADFLPAFLTRLGVHDVRHIRIDAIRNVRSNDMRLRLDSPRR